VPVVFILPAFLFLSCKEENLKSVEFFQDADSIPVEVANNIEIIYTDSARLKARLEAPVMQRYVREIEGSYNTDEYIIMPDGLFARFYDKSGAITNTLRSEYGERYLNEEKTVLKRNVVVVNSQGDSLNTELLNWEEKEDKISSDKNVRVRTEEQIIFAEGFESNLEFTDYKFFKIKGILELDSE